VSEVHSFRPGLEFDVAALEAYLLVKLEGFSAITRVAQFAGGQSNPTYRLEVSMGSEARTLVLRRKPPGQLLPSAHAVDREFRVMQALGKVGFPVAETLLLCEDAAVIGTPFFLMQHLQGRIFWNPALPELERDARRAIFLAMASTLADLHRVDVVASGLADYGRAEGYVARQVARWSKQYAGDSAVAGRVEAMERLIDWLPKHAPSEEPAAALVHGDFRIDNMMFANDAPQVIGVLDWELSTIGNPLADFAYNFMMYRIQSAAIPGLRGFDLQALGLPSERDYIACYCERRGISEIVGLDYYVAFCMFRLAGIFHGIRGRVERGTAVSPQARKYAAEVESMAELAWQQAEQTHSV